MSLDPRHLTEIYKIKAITSTGMGDVIAVLSETIDHPPAEPQQSTSQQEPTS
jgi:hypothetical protein